MIKILSVLFLSMIIVGCSSTSYHTGEYKSSYTPTAIGVEENDNVATLKVASGLTILKVDGERQVNVVRMVLGRGFDSLLLAEGEHYMTGSIKGKDLRIKKASFLGGHEYFLDYLRKDSGNRMTVYYWIKDITDDRVILGREVTVEELKNK